MNLQVNQIFAGRYKLIEKIGIGGFSEVWKVSDEMAEDKIVVLKLYAPERGLDNNGLKQFRREYSITLDIAHQNLLNANYFDIFEGSPFLIMPFCPGGSLNDKLIESGPFSEAQLASMLVQVCTALCYLHDHEIVHQDIKPDNVLINKRGDYLLTDFGISNHMRNTLNKSTRSSQAMTIAYAPPERFKGNAKTLAASDIFSLGVMCFELLTGDLPWSGMGGAYLTANTELPLLGSNHSISLQTILHKCLALEPNNRIKAKEILDRAEVYLKTSNWDESNASVKPVLRETIKIAFEEPIPSNSAQEIKEFQYPLKSYWKVWHFIEDMALVADSSSSTPFGFINKTGMQAIPCQYKDAKAFSEGYAAVQLPNKWYKRDMWGYIDKIGNLMIEDKYHKADNFYEQLARVILDDKFGFINQKGQSIVPPNYSQARNYSEGLAAVMAKDKWGYIDQNGNMSIALTFDQTLGFSEGLAPASINRKWGYIDNQSNVVIPFQFDNASNFKGGFAIVRKEMSYLIINSIGETIGKPKQHAYSNISPLSESFFKAIGTGGQGFLDKLGNEIIETKYMEVQNFSEGLAAVKLASPWHKTDNYWGFIDKSNNLLIPNKYLEVSKFSQGIAAVKQDYDYNWGYINKLGALISFS
jgi:serine/threonine protein kinase